MAAPVNKQNIYQYKIPENGEYYVKKGTFRDFIQVCCVINALLCKNMTISVVIHLYASTRPLKTRSNFPEVWLIS